MKVIDLNIIKISSSEKLIKSHPRENYCNSYKISSLENIIKILSEIFGWSETLSIRWDLKIFRVGRILKFFGFFKMMEFGEFIKFFKMMRLLSFSSWSSWWYFKNKHAITILKASLFSSSGTFYKVTVCDFKKSLRIV